MISELTRERLYPWIGSLIVALVSWFLVHISTYETAVSRLVDPIITVSTLASGFLLAVTTLLISMERRVVIQELRGIGAYNVLLGYLRSSIYVWLLMSAFSIFTVLIEAQVVVPLTGFPWFRISFALWSFLLTLGFLTTLRVVRIMFALLRYGSGSGKHRQLGREDETESRLAVPHTRTRA